LSETPLVEVRREGETCVIRLRREEKLNALSTRLEQELAEAIAGEPARSARCVVFTGGDRAFSAGADVNELRDLDPAAILAYYRETGEVYERIAALPQPTVSAIAGWCLGGGLELALATDFRIADESAVLGFPEVGIGIVPSSGGTHRAVRLLGPAKAKELVLLGDRLTARDALAAGLVTEVVPDGRSLPRSLELAERLAALPHLAVELAKATIDRIPETSREGGILLERLAYGMLAQTEEARSAATEFVERRSRP